MRNIKLKFDASNHMFCFLLKLTSDEYFLQVNVDLPSPPIPAEICHTEYS